MTSSKIDPFQINLACIQNRFWIYCLRLFLNEQDNPARIRFRFFSLIWHSPNLIFVKCCSSSKLGHIIFLDEVFLILESFQGFSLFSYQGSLLLSIKRGNLYILPRIRPLVNNFLKIILKKTERRRRDLNPRAGFPTYTLSRGTSSATWVLLLARIVLVFHKTKFDFYLFCAVTQSILYALNIHLSTINIIFFNFF